MRFEIYREDSPERDWRWRLVAVSGKNIAGSSTGYPERADCETSVELVKRSSGAPVEILDDA